MAYCSRCDSNTIHWDDGNGNMTCQTSGGSVLTNAIDYAAGNWALGIPPWIDASDYATPTVRAPEFICGAVCPAMVWCELQMYSRKLRARTARIKTPLGDP